jgi:hypothetical protein
LSCIIHCIIQDEDDKEDDKADEEAADKYKDDKAAAAAADKPAEEGEAKQLEEGEIPPTPPTAKQVSGCMHRRVQKISRQVYVLLLWY